MTFGIRQTLDALATPSTDLATLPVTTSNIWANEANPARVWAASDDIVYRSTDNGVTFTAMAACPDIVTWVIEDPAVDNSVFVACGADILHATNPTVGWTVLYAGPVGAIARQFVRSRDGQVTWICYTDAPSGAALQRIENGAAADFAATDVQTLTLDKDASILRATIYAITLDDPAEIWSFDGLTGLDAFQSTQTFPAGATVMHMLADPEFPVIYTADFDSVAEGTGAVRKWLPQMDRLLLKKAGEPGWQGHMLGFGGGVRTPAQILLGTTGTATSGGGIWIYDRAWSLRNTGLPSDWRWLWVSANPFNAAEWLALSNSASGTAINFSVASGGKITVNDSNDSPLWYTNDSGATWTEVVIPHPTITGAVSGAGASSPAKAARVSWQTAQSGWIFTITSDGGISGYDRRTSWWRGSGLAITDGPHTSALIGGFGWQSILHESGRDNDIVFLNNYDGRGQFYVAGDATVETLVGTFGPLPFPTDFEAGALSPSLVEVTSGGALYYSADYRNDVIADTGLSGLTAITGTAAGWVATHSTGLWVYELTPSSATVVPGTEADGLARPRADRQTRTIVAARSGTSVLLYDTALGVLTRIPLPVDYAQLSLTAIEPIVRPA
jgi:hypothetical protein